MNGRMRVLIVGLTVTVALLAVAGGAGAAPPHFESIDVNISVVDSYFTQRCGFEVRFFNIGTFNATLFVDATGTVVREIDTYPGDNAGWS